MVSHCSYRRKTAAAVAIAAFAFARTAGADGTSPASPERGRDLDQKAPSAGRSEGTSGDRSSAAHSSVHVGILGGVGFPRPLAIDGLVFLGERVAVGAEYGALPSVTIDNVRASLWSLAAEARVFPFAGPFYAGLRAGHQHVEASTTIGLPRFGPSFEELALDSWFVNPRVGVLWASSPGFAFGMEAGLQIPISPSISSSLPLALLPVAQHTAESLGSTVLPTVDLLRVGGVL
jgi:hypothetical protein